MELSPPRSQFTSLPCCHPGGVAMDFPIVDLLDEEACYRQLVAWLPPQGLACPTASQRIGGSSIAATVSPSSMIAAALAAGSSTPSPAPPSRARTIAPPR